MEAVYAHVEDDEARKLSNHFKILSMWSYAPIGKKAKSRAEFVQKNILTKIVSTRKKKVGSSTYCAISSLNMIGEDRLEKASFFLLHSVLTYGTTVH